MKYKISRIQKTKSGKMDIAPVITGYDEILIGDSVDGCFRDYRYYHAEEGGMSWDLCAIGPDGSEEYDRGGQEEEEEEEEFF